MRSGGCYWNLWDAYENGIIIVFPDGVSRCVFPRFFIYSSDYPEKYVD